MPTNFLQTLLRLVIALKPLGLLQRRIEGLKRQLVIAERANPFDGFHHGLVPKGRQMLRIHFFEPKLPSPSLSGLTNSAPDKIRRRLQALPRFIGPGHSLLWRIP